VSQVQVEQVNPRNEPLLRALWEAGHAAWSDRPVDLWIDWEDARRRWPLPGVDTDVRTLAAFSENRVVGGARLDMPESDNTHLLFADTWVAPPDRRRGYGTALADEIERIARDSGRTTVLTGAHVPVGGESDGSRFALARGYQVAGIEEVKVADLAATEELWPGLAELAAERTADYDVVAWTGPTPVEHMDALCALFSRFLTEAPLGDMDIQPMTWTPERVRQEEERMERAGVDHLLVAAVAPDGSLVGYSKLRVSRAAPRLAALASTLVLPEHRGHRLGLAMKVRLHQEARQRFPACELVGTGNASVNRWMNAVNEQLGYVVVDRCLDLQKVLV
jgi:GNAT superfamily N-acetyltransferase